MRFTLSSIALLIATLLSLSNAKTPQGDTITIASKYIDPAMNVIVVTPQSYNPGSPTQHRYPVVYLLHGYSDDYKCWPTRTQPGLDSLANVYNMIFVCPDGRDSWYFDSKLNPKMQMESFFVHDLVPYIDANYPTIADPAHRAITGLSMGGHGAMWLAIRHSDIWGNAGSTSGGVDFTPFAPNCWSIDKALGDYNTNRDVWEHSTVMSLVPTLKPGQLNIIFDCGVDDFFFQVNNNLHDALLKAGIPHDYITRPGVHNHPYWRNAILFQLQYFNQKFNQQ